MELDENTVSKTLGNTVFQTVSRYLPICLSVCGLLCQYVGKAEDIHPEELHFIVSAKEASFSLKTYLRATSFASFTLASIETHIVQTSQAVRDPNSATMVHENDVTSNSTHLKWLAGVFFFRYDER